VNAGEIGSLSKEGELHVLSLAQLKKNADAAREVEALRSALAREEARAKALEVKITALEKARAESEKAREPDASEPATPPAPAPVPPPAPEPSADDRVRAIVEGVEWPDVMKAFVTFAKAQKSGRSAQLEPSTYVALSKLNIVAAEVAKVRGLTNPYAAYADPILHEAFLPAWLDALGADLDVGQRDAVRKMAREEKPKVGDAPRRSFLASVRSDLADQIELEKTLATLLRPDQHARYLENIGDDPFFGRPMSEREMTSPIESTLVDKATADLVKRFELSGPAVKAAQVIAARWVKESLAVPPVDPSLDPAARRLATLRRTAALADLQERVEKELAQDSALTVEERARVSQGSRTLVRVSLVK
jgi:hypothetical protein